MGGENLGFDQQYLVRWELVGFCVEQLSNEKWVQVEDVVSEQADADSEG